MIASTVADPLEDWMWADRTRARVSSVVLCVYLLMITKGPVFWIRLDAAPLSGDFIDDRWVQAAFVVSSICLITVSYPAWRQLSSQPVVPVSCAVFSILVFSSGFWSVSPARTFQQGGMLVLGTAAVLLAGAYVGRRQALIALWAALQIGVASSIFAELSNWPRARDQWGDLAGIYFSRNSLGPVAMLGAVTSVVLVLLVHRQPRGREMSVGLAVVAIVDLIVLRMSGSLTTILAAFVAASAVCLLLLLVPGPQYQIRRRVAVIVVPAVFVGVWVVVLARSAISERLGKPPTFSGRTVMWGAVWDFIAVHPLQGWGFMAIWTQPEIVARIAEGNDVVYEAHSGYLEVLLGVGVLGLISLVAVVIGAVGRTARGVLNRPGILSFWSFWLVIYAIVINLGETYVGANLLPWALLLLATGQTLASTEPDCRSVDVRPL